MKLTSQELTSRIRDMILHGDFAAGQHLKEAALAHRFEVSRTPVRAALAANEKDGLLEYSPNRGYVVRPFHIHEIADAFEMRAVLEGAACRLVAERGMRLDAERDARRAVDAVERLLDTDEPLDELARQAWRRNNLVFHKCIFDELDNKFLPALLQTVQQIPSVYPPIFSRYTKDELTLYNEQHKTILECVIDRQGARAEFLMREHILTAKTVLITTLRERADAPLRSTADDNDPIDNDDTA